MNAPFTARKPILETYRKKYGKMTGTVDRGKALINPELKSIKKIPDTVGALLRIGN